MRTWVRRVLVLIAALSVGPTAPAQEKGGQDETGPYAVVESWLKPLPGHDGWTFGPIGGVFAETPNRIFIVMRGEVAVPRAHEAFDEEDRLKDPKQRANVEKIGEKVVEMARKLSAG